MGYGILERVLLKLKPKMLLPTLISKNSPNYKLPMTSLNGRLNWAPSEFDCY